MGHLPRIWTAFSLRTPKSHFPLGIHMLSGKLLLIPPVPHLEGEAHDLSKAIKLPLPLIVGSQMGR